MFVVLLLPTSAAAWAAVSINLYGYLMLNDNPWVVVQLKSS